MAIMTYFVALPFVRSGRIGGFGSPRRGWARENAPERASRCRPNTAQFLLRRHPHLDRRRRRHVGGDETGIVTDHSFSKSRGTRTPSS
jgi:hypothetical protein